MAQWHLDELQAALEKQGWRLISTLPGDDRRISASWQFERSGTPAHLMIDFHGLADLETLPVEQAYAAAIRGTKHSLYFSRRGLGGSQARQQWLDELAGFIGAANMIGERLTVAVVQRIGLLFPENERAEVERLVAEYCAGTEWAVDTPCERVPIAALKCSNGTMAGLHQALNLAKTDWRDLLVAAGFAHDVKAHLKWLPSKEAK